MISGAGGSACTPGGCSAVSGGWIAAAGAGEIGPGNSGSGDSDISGVFVTAAARFCTEGSPGFSACPSAGRDSFSPGTGGASVCVETAGGCSCSAGGRGLSFFPRPVNTIGARISAAASTSPAPRITGSLSRGPDPSQNSSSFFRIVVTVRSDQSRG